MVDLQAAKGRHKTVEEELGNQKKKGKRKKRKKEKKREKTK